MDRAALLKKAESNIGLTVKEIIAYRKIVKPVTHVYDKYGSLAKAYLEEHNPSKLWVLAGDVPKYLLGIDSQAANMYEAIYARLSSSDRFSKTGEYVSDLQKETEMQKLIEEEILNELVFVN